MFAFNKKHRLICKPDYDNVFKCAKKITNTEFIVLYKENNKGFARLGLALSKKNISLAYQRNRVKRLLRENFRKQLLPAVDIIFLAKHGVSNCNNKLLVTNLHLIWNKLHQS